MKGSLIRDILYPKEIHFKFYDDGMKFVGIMACLALIGIITTIPIQYSMGIPFEYLIDSSLDLITVTVPPALPAAMSCGIVFAINRLKKQKIFCISPPRVNLAGQITTFVFDKTGTLTEDGLTVKGVRAVSSECTFSDELELTYIEAEIEEKSFKLAEAMASCTAVTYVDRKLVGDPLDVMMFQSTGWILDESAGPSEARVYPPSMQ